MLNKDCSALTPQDNPPSKPVIPQDNPVGNGQKNEFKIQDDSLTYTENAKTREKAREKTREKIIQAIKEDSNVSTSGLSELLGISSKGVEWQLKQLKDKGIIRRVGPDKGGHWEVVEK